MTRARENWSALKAWVPSISFFKDKGYRESGPDPLNGKGGYINPRTGRSYHIDPKEYGKYREPNHIDVNRPRGYTGPLDKRKLPY